MDDAGQTQETQPSPVVALGKITAAGLAYSTTLVLEDWLFDGSGGLAAVLPVFAGIARLPTRFLLPQPARRHRTTPPHLDPRGAAFWLWVGAMAVAMAALYALKDDVPWVGAHGALFYGLTALWLGLGVETALVWPRVRSRGERPGPGGDVSQTSGDELSAD